MTDKSYVSLEQKVCMVCGTKYDTNTLLIDRRIQDSMERYTVTGWGLCPEHEKMHKDGFVALIEAQAPAGTTGMKPEDANRTGKVAHIKRKVCPSIFSVEIPDDQPVLFVEPGVIDKLEAMMEKGDDNQKV